MTRGDVQHRHRGDHVDAAAVNPPPTANAGPDQTVNANSTVNLDGTASSDVPPGTVASYAWTQTGGPSVTLSGANTATPSFTAPNNLTTSPTDLTFSLVVTDNQGATSAADTVVIHDTDQQPTANAGPDQAVTGGLTVNLNGTGSSDPNGDTLTYAWTQTAGPPVTLSGANTATPSFTTPNANDDLTFQLQVCDPAAMCSTDTVNITVTVPVIDGSGQVIVNGPVSHTKTSKSFVFKVSNLGSSPLTINPADVTSSVDVNGTTTGSVSVSGLPLTLNPGASSG